MELTQNFHIIKIRVVTVGLYVDIDTLFPNCFNMIVISAYNAFRRCSETII